MRSPYRGSFMSEDKLKGIGQVVIYVALFAIVMAAALVSAETIYARDISVVVNGQRVQFADQQPVVIDGRTLVPVRGVFEIIGFDVNWNESTRTITLSRLGYSMDEIVITLGSNEFVTNGVRHVLDVPAQSIGGRTVLPIRLVLESVGYTVDWNENERIVNAYIEPSRTILVRAWERGLHGRWQVYSAPAGARWFVGGEVLEFGLNGIGREQLGTEGWDFNWRLEMIDHAAYSNMNIPNLDPTQTVRLILTYDDQELTFFPRESGGARVLLLEDAGPPIVLSR